MFQSLKDARRLKKANKKMKKKYGTYFGFGSIKCLDDYLHDRKVREGYFEVSVGWHHSELWWCIMWPVWTDVGPKWCQENSTGKYYFGSKMPDNVTDITVYFENAEDAMAFKLRWL